MKYIEELKPGDLFAYKDCKFLLTSNFKRKSNNTIHYEAIALDNGSSRWLAADYIVDVVDLYYRDKEGNILLLKEFKDEDHMFQNKNLS